ncbi:hypothetical protein FXO38_35517, partial [Capsicum annuum]
SSGIKETVRPSGIEERVAELSSSGNKVEVMPNEIEKPAAELASSGSKVVVMPKEIVKESGGSLPDVESVQHQSNVEGQLYSGVIFGFITCIKFLTPSADNDLITPFL